MSSFFIDPNIAKAKTLDTAFYTSAEHLQTAKEKIFAPSWQFIGSRDMVKFPGDVHPFVLLKGYLDEHLMLTHDNNGINCISNVCTHRGNLVAYKACSRASTLRCKYHGRVFELDGTFVSMPEFKEVLDFPCDDDHLPKLPLHSWGNMLFTSLTGNDGDEHLYFQEMKERLSWLPIHEFVHRPDLSKTFEVNANWALYCENYLEGFHIPFVHASLNAALSFGDYTTELYAKSCLQIGVGKNDEDCFDLPASSPDYGSKIAAYYYWVYPNMMFNFYPWGLSVNIVKPLSPTKTKVDFITYMWKEELYDKGAGSNLDKVELEDEEIVENVQLGISSRFYKHGRYSVTRETGTHHFHRLIAESMGNPQP